MKRCPRCQTMNAVAANFCASCGTPFAASPPPAGQAPRPAMPPHAGHPMPAPMVAPRRRPMWPWAIVGLALLSLAIAGGVAGLARIKAQQQAGLARTTAEGNAGVTRTTADPNGGVTRVTADPNAGVTKTMAAPPPETKRMPPHILDYLLHVERTERMRERVAGDHLGKAQTLMAELTVGGGMDALKALLNSDPSSDAELPKPADKAKVKIEDMKAEWKKVRDYFNSVQPPSECVTLRDQFDAALNETGAMMVDLVDILSNVGSDTSTAVASLESMKGKSVTIDKAAKAANGQVQEVCQRYDVRPWFEIQADFGGNSSILKMIGR